MIPSSDKAHLHHISKFKNKPKVEVLKTAAIYGANASGKSNLIRAMAFSRQLILKGTQADDSINVAPFKLSDDCKKSPSKFQYLFQYKEAIYDYGFSADTERVWEEWLFVKTHTRFKKMFERKTNKNGKSRYEFGPSLVRRSATKKYQRYEFVMDGTRKNQLFITEAYDKNIKEVKDARQWFSNVLKLVSPDSEFPDIAFRVGNDTEFKKFLVSLLRASDIGVSNVEVKKHNFSFDIGNLPEILPVGVRERMLKDLKNDIDLIKPDSSGIVISIPDRGSILSISKDKDGEIKRLEFYLTRLASDNKIADFKIEEESDGTQRLIQLSGALFDLLCNDRIYIVDELERKLHPLLLKSFVEKFLDAARDKQCSQLIFATHETHILDLDLLRRDEVWLMEKDSEHSSHLYSLLEFKIRNGINLRKGYLNGRFGAIPFISDLARLGWIEEGACEYVEEDTPTKP